MVDWVFFSILTKKYNCFPPSSDFKYDDDDVGNDDDDDDNNNNNNMVIILLVMCSLFGTF